MSKIKQQTDESEEFDEDDEKDQQKIQIRKPKIERLDKFKNLKKIVINVSMTQYPVVRDVAQQLNWKVQTSNDAGDWDVYWTDFAIDPDVLIRMHLFQKINHYPGIHVIARKNLLGLGLMALRSKFPDQYNFFPLTWMLPSQYAEFRQYYEDRPKGKCRTYIVKPQAQCQGRGIFLTRKIEQLQNGKHYVVQRYIARPYLIDGLKFDFRIYVLLSGTDPLRLYIYNQGLARFATEKYVQPSSANLDQVYVHLTNYAINKNNPKFIFNTNSSNMSIGHKRSLTSVYKQLATKGVDIQKLKKQINDIAIKTIITGLPLMSHQYKCSQPQDYSGNMCFHILGLDVMLNNKAQPILIEVNHTPSFTTDTPLDYMIKKNLIKDSLILMNINTKKKQQLFNRCRDYNQERLLTGKRHIFQGQNRKRLLEQAQLERDDYQNKHLGGFEKIYPTSDNTINQKYQHMIQISNKIYLEQNGSIRTKMEEKEGRKLMRIQRKKQKQMQINQKISPKQQGNNDDKDDKDDDEKQQEQKPQKKKRPWRQTESQSVSPIITRSQRIQNIQYQLIKEQVNILEKQSQKKHQNSQKGVINYPIANQIRKRTKSKQSNIKPKNNIQQLPLIQNQSGFHNSGIVIYNKSGSNDKKIQQNKHKEKNIHSEPKTNKIIQNINKDLQQYTNKKNSGGYVMPKIFLLNFEFQRKQLQYLSMMKKVQSANCTDKVNE